MSRRADHGPVVFDVSQATSLRTRLAQAARQMPARRRAKYVREVCHGCADVISLTPVSTWMEYVVTLLEGLDASGESNTRFRRELERLIPVLQGRAGGGPWRHLRR